MRRLDDDIRRLHDLTAELPGPLQAKLNGFADEVRGQYRTLIVGTWIASVTAALFFALFVRLFYRWIFRPLEILIRGSRKVAGGNFDFRIRMDTHDEMSELAEAMNDMTLAVPHDPRRSGPPGPGAHQAGGPQRAIGQRRLSGGRRGPRNQQPAGLDRHVRRIAGRPHPRVVGRRTAADDGRRRPTSPSSPTTCG